MCYIITNAGQNSNFIVQNMFTFDTIKFKIISHRFICFKKLLFHSPLLTKNTNKFKTTQHIFILMDLSKFKPLFYYLILIVIYIDF